MLLLMKMLSVRLADDVAEYVAACAAQSHQSVNKTIEAILRTARDAGWSEISMIPVVRRPEVNGE